MNLSVRGDGTGLDVLKWIGKANPKRHPVLVLIICNLFDGHWVVILVVLRYAMRFLWIGVNATGCESGAVSEVQEGAESSGEGE